jgi:hypothetical protein
MTSLGQRNGRIDGGFRMPRRARGLAGCRRLDPEWNLADRDVGQPPSAGPGQPRADAPHFTLCGQPPSAAPHDLATHVSASVQGPGGRGRRPKGDAPGGTRLAPHRCRFSPALVATIPKSRTIRPTTAGDGTAPPPGVTRDHTSFAPPRAPPVPIAAAAPLSRSASPGPKAARPRPLVNTARRWRVATRRHSRCD